MFLSRSTSILVALLLPVIVYVSPAQTARKAILTGSVKDSLTGEYLRGAAVAVSSSSGASSLGAITRGEGTFRIANIPAGTYTLTAKYLGYETFSTTLTVSAGDSLHIELALAPNEVETDEIVVSATRTARKIDDIPLRMEILPAADLDESITVGIASAKMVLGELPGVMPQTNSAATGAATVRLRGLDGRYTQILQDGIPAFGGLNMNFSVLTLPPLNLRQLEIIKGSAAGLYSADAIGGVINYITKSPERATPELTAVASYGTLGNLDAGAFYGQKFGNQFGNLGVSLHATGSLQPKRDLDGDGFADVPQQRRFTVNPKLTYEFSPDTRLMLAAAYTREERQGGEMAASEVFARIQDFTRTLADSAFLAALVTARFNVAASFSHKLTEASNLAISAAFAQTERTSLQASAALATPFAGTETIAYADAHYALDVGAWKLLAGGAAMNQVFAESTRDPITNAQRTFAFTMLSAFAQSEYAFSEEYRALASLRLDNHNRYGLQASPRLSFMAKASHELTFRASAGLGWRAPTVFDETAEERNFRGVPAMTLTQPERSQSLTLDGEYKTVVGDLSLAGNVALFLTQIQNQAALTPQNLMPNNRNQTMLWINDGSLLSRGAEVILEAKTHDLSLFFGYTFADVTQTVSGFTTRKDLTPQHFINAAVLWEEHDVVRLVSDFMLQSPQQLSSNPYLSTSPTVVTWGGSVEVWLGAVLPGLSVFLNGENVLDFRQTRFMPLFLGSPRTANFSSGLVWGPVDGRVISLGAKYKL